MTIAECRWCCKPEGTKACVSCSNAISASRMCSGSWPSNRCCSLFPYYHNMHKAPTIVANSQVCYCTLLHCYTATYVLLNAHNDLLPACLSFK